MNTNLITKLEAHLDKFRDYRQKFKRRNNLPRTLISNALNKDLDIETRIDNLTLLPKIVSLHRYTSMMILEKEIIQEIVDAVVKAIPNYNKTWLTPDELEGYLGISKSTQNKYRMRNNNYPDIPYNKIGNNVLYNREKIDEWVSSGEMTK